MMSFWAGWGWWRPFWNDLWLLQCCFLRNNRAKINENVLLASFIKWNCRCIGERMSWHPGLRPPWTGGYCRGYHFYHKALEHGSCTYLMWVGDKSNCVLGELLGLPLKRCQAGSKPLQASVLQALGHWELACTGPVRETACVTAWSPDCAQLI